MKKVFLAAIVCTFSLWLPNVTANNIAQAQQTFYRIHSFELKVVELVNLERAKHNLKPLFIHPGINKLAREKSEDMRDKNYFDHKSPTFGRPCDHMEMKGFPYLHCGENIAAGYETPKSVVDAWMNSADHRVNILNPDYTYIGVGYVDGGSAQYESYWTQQFFTPKSH